tara:strand:- start:9379 stop:9918 length:540 start_codon:yes stop_codon:yes gene_type:complete
MNNITTARPHLQGHYPTAHEPEVHPIKVEIAKNLGSFTFTATFEEDREAIEAFKNEGLIAYRCILSTPDGKVLGIGHGLNVLSQQNRYISKSVKWAHSGAFIAAVTNAVKFPDLSGSPTPDFGMSQDLASTFMASQKQKDYLKQLVANVADEEEREELLANLESLSKEDASELIGRLRN